MKFAAITLSVLSVAHAATPIPRFSHGSDGNHVQNVLNDLSKTHALHATDNTDITFMYQDALLDHYDTSVLNPSADAKWDQKFYYDDRFWCGEGCPVFLMIGGEGPQGPISEKLFMYGVAEEQGALMVSLEHRYYGESYPTKDMSNPNLVYLTSSQALADLARFIEYISSLSPQSTEEELCKAEPCLTVKAPVKDSKWVSFGGSYPGNLATWLKLKYPSSVVGTIGSSAPVKGDYNYFKYAQVVGSALKYPLIGGSDQCYAVVEKATQQVHDLASKKGGAKNLPASLMPCKPIKDEKDLYAYESTIFGNFQGAVQYNMQSSAATVSDLCTELIKDEHSDPLAAMASMVQMFYGGEDGEAVCIPSSWDELIGELQNEEFDGQSAMRQWVYQSCNEFGYFQTTEGDGHPFTSLTSCSLEIAGKLMCEEAYGIKNYKGPLKNGAGMGDTYASDERYGARSIIGANITMPNGNMDPWHSLGVVNETAKFYADDQVTTEGDTVVFIDGTAHCRDMYAPNAFAPKFNDTGSVVWAHKKIKEQVLGYLA